MAKRTVKAAPRSDDRRSDPNELSDFFAEWMDLRAHNGVTDAEIEKNTKRMDDLARLICVMPARTGNDVLLKIQVLEWQLDLEADAGTSCVDHRAIPMLAGIKADLYRFTPTDEAVFWDLLRSAGAARAAAGTSTAPLPANEAPRSRRG